MIPNRNSNRETELFSSPYTHVLVPSKKDNLVLLLQPHFINVYHFSIFFLCFQPLHQIVQNMLMSTLKLLFITLLSIIVSSAIIATADEAKNSVTYDGRSLIINGKPELLFSGSIHYPRSTPEVPSFSSNIMRVRTHVCEREIPA